MTRVSLRMQPRLLDAYRRPVLEHPAEAGLLEGLARDRRRHFLSHAVWLAAPLALLALVPIPLSAAAPAPVSITGELKQWHKVTMTVDGPHVRERQTGANPFLDYRFTVRFAHESGTPVYEERRSRTTGIRIEGCCSRNWRPVGRRTRP